LESVHYSFLRTLSNQLAQQGYPLEGVVCRRILIDGVLVKAQSKYYKYAVNDLKQAMKFSEDIQEWGSILSQADYHEKLKETHKRKLSLWQLVQEADLKI
ncbi:DUF6880 family protein, partial [Piscirickettsia salmonis]